MNASALTAYSFLSDLTPYKKIRVHSRHPNKDCERFGTRTRLSCHPETHMGHPAVGKPAPYSRGWRFLSQWYFRRSGNLRLRVREGQIRLLLQQPGMSGLMESGESGSLLVDFCERVLSGAKSNSRKVDTAIRCRSIDVVCVEAGGKPKLH